MARQNNKPEFQNPLSEAQYETMKQLAKYAKENELLEGKDRKKLYQAGRYEMWFSGMFSSLPENLDEIIPDLDDSEGAPAVKEVESICDIIVKAGTRYGIVNDGGTTSKTELMLLAEKYEAGDAEPPERLTLAEPYEESGDMKAARRVAKSLKKEFSDNENVKALCKRWGI